jgi:hypothetical protein
MKVKPPEVSEERKLQQAFEKFMKGEGVPPNCIGNGPGWTLHVSAMWRSFKAGHATQTK